MTPAAVDEGDYDVVYFVRPVTFRGRTVDVLRRSERSDKGLTATHSQSHLVVRFEYTHNEWVDGKSHETHSMQTQLVPWANVAQAEPNEKFLGEYEAAMRAARGGKAK